MRLLLFYTLCFSEVAALSQAALRGCRRSGGRNVGGCFLIGTCAADGAESVAFLDSPTKKGPAPWTDPLMQPMRFGETRSHLRIRDAKCLQQLVRLKRHTLATTCASETPRACSNLRACNVTRSRQPWSWQRPGRPPSSRRCEQECSHTQHPRCCATR